MNKTIAEVSKQTLRIEGVLKTFRPGEYIPYHTIEQLSGVRMDHKGKGYLRTALNRLRIEYSPVIGKGIELASPTNAISIVSKRVIRIDNSVKKAEKTTRRVTDQFYNQLTEAEQNNVNFIGSAFAAIRLYSQSAKKFFQKPEHKPIN